MSVASVTSVPARVEMASGREWMMECPIIVIGGSPAALTLASEAQRAGLETVPILTSGPVLAPPSSTRGLSIRNTLGEVEVTAADDGGVRVAVDGEVYHSSVCVFDTGSEIGQAPIPWPVTDELAGRIHTLVDFEPEDCDVLVIGDGDSVVAQCSDLAARGARVVLCYTGRTRDLSVFAQQLIDEMEREQRITVLWRSAPEAVLAVGGFPMATFGDRRTPDLQFDHVVVARTDSRLPAADIGEGVGPNLYLIAETEVDGWPGSLLAPSEVWSEIRAAHFPNAPVFPAMSEIVDEDRARDLARAHYNATITLFDTAHNELWRIRVRPDRESSVHRPGQYCSIGVGLWEPRADDVTEPGLEANREKLVRRSYSISSPIFDDHGYLADHVEMDEIELYMVLVRPSEDRVPSLTPRLAMKRIGDRVYLGPKVAGRYTLSPVVDPGCPVLFCATGTGEAPHNAMIVELLRKGHHGPIVSAVSVRYRSDLAYLEEHRRLEGRFANYRYLPHPTREADVPKRYLQDLLADGTLEDALGRQIDETAHVYLCGNPAMIGLPEWAEEGPVFPTPSGMAEALADRGLTLDRRGVAGSVHFEEYW